MYVCTYTEYGYSIHSTYILARMYTQQITLSFSLISNLKRRKSTRMEKQIGEYRPSGHMIIYVNISDWQPRIVKMKSHDKIMNTSETKLSVCALFSFS